MTGMTGRQRVTAALVGQPHDRVPYMELYIDEGFAHQLLGQPAPAVPTPMSGSGPFSSAYFGGSQFDPAELARELGLDGLVYAIQPQIFFDAHLTDGHYFIAGGKIRRRADLPLFQLHDPDDPAIYAPARRFLEQHRPTGLALGCFINLGSDPVILSMGWDYFAYAIYDDPALLDTLFEGYSAWFARAVRHICDLGFDFIWAGDDIAFKSGPMISPRAFRRFFLPHYARVAREITVPWIFHTDGDFLPLLDDLLGLGMNALHPLEPDAVDIRAVKSRVAGRAGLVGNIDINLLSLGEPDAVAAAVRETLQAAAGDGRFILSSSNSITRSCRPENVRAMVAAGRRYGAYTAGALTPAAEPSEVL